MLVNPARRLWRRADDLAQQTSVPLVASVWRLAFHEQRRPAASFLAAPSPQASWTPHFVAGLTQGRQLSNVHVLTWGCQLQAGVVISEEPLSVVTPAPEVGLIRRPPPESTMISPVLEGICPRHPPQNLPQASPAQLRTLRNAVYKTATASSQGSDSAAMIGRISPTHDRLATTAQK